MAAGHAARCGRGRGARRGLAAEHLHRSAGARDALRAGARGVRRMDAGTHKGADVRARVATVALAAGGARAGIPGGARPGAARGPAVVLLVRSPRRLGLSPAGRRLPDAPRPGLRAPGPAQLLRPVPARLLRHGLSLRRGHAVRRQRLHRRRAADLDDAAVQRLHARARRRAGVGASAAHRPRRRVGLVGDAHGDAARARLRLRVGGLGQGDRLTEHDPRAGRARRAAPLLAVAGSARGDPARVPARGRHRGARGGVRRVGAGEHARARGARRGRDPGRPAASERAARAPCASPRRSC